MVEQNEWSYIPNLKALKPKYMIHGDDWNSEIKNEVIKEMSAWGPVANDRVFNTCELFF